MRQLFIALLMILSATLSCSGQRITLRVGAKSFAEQAILSEMVARLLRQHGGAEVSTVTCGDTYACYRDLQQGRIDLLVDYSGTGLAFLGRARMAQQDSLDSVRKLYAPLGLSWLGPLGFDNSYRILVKNERAATLGLSTIGDLDKVEQGIRIACPAEYIRRPQDGLAALVQRYGLRLAGAPLVIREPDRRVQALFDGRVDVAVGYATDGAHVSLGLKELEDDLQFFPPYEAAVVIRSEVLSQAPRLRRVLARLEGTLDTETMRRLNYEVQVEGREAVVVAKRFLQQRKLRGGGAQKRRRASEMTLVVHRRDHLDTMVTLATHAIRAVFPDRPVTVHAHRDPVEQVFEGKARLAVLGAERFFYRDGDRSPRREERVEALAVLSTRMVHLVRKQNGSPPPADPLVGRIGVSEPGSGRALVAHALVAFSEGKVAAQDDPQRLLAMVSEGKLDAALLLVELGDAELARALSQDGLKLYSLAQDDLKMDSTDGWLSPEQAVQIPYLRPARIPADTYSGQPEPVETLGAQVVLAGLAPTSAMVGAGGPAAAMPTSKPLSRKEIEALAKATRVAEAPDPVLPSAWGFQASGRERSEDRDTGAAVLDTLLNVLAIAFLIWLVLMILRYKGETAPAK
jgi:osmoprotectant transport system substrate-binding protein